VKRIARLNELLLKVLSSSVQRTHFVNTTMIANPFRQLLLVSGRRVHARNEEAHRIRRPVVSFFLKLLRDARQRFYDIPIDNI
jgi:hypothetical protein